MTDPKAQARFIILRYDNYISAANTKGNFLLVFTTFLTGGIISNYSKLKDLVDPKCGLTLLDFCLVTIIVVCLIITALAIMAVHPFLTSGNSIKDSYNSHIFFNSVASFSSDLAFSESYIKQTDEEVDVDLAYQARELAVGLKRKYLFLNWAMRLVYVLILLLLVLLIIITRF